LSVDKLDPVIEIVPDTPVTAHKPTSVNITVSNETSTLPANENVTVIITQGKEVLVNKTFTTDENGTVTVDYTPVNIDDITITAIYNETPVYNSAENATTIGNIKPINTHLKITSQDVAINGTSLIKLNATDDEANPVTGMAILTIDGNLVEVEINDGIGEYEYTNTTIGRNVTIAGYVADNETNGYIRSSVTETTFEVQKLPIAIAIETSDLTAHKNATTTITLTNETDKTVPTEAVNVIITDDEGNILANETVTTDDKGQATVNFIPVTGTPVTVSVEHPESDVYLENATNETKEVTPIATEIALEVTNTTINGTSTITVTVSDEDGKPVTGDVDLTFTDEKGNTDSVTVTTDEDGTTTYNYTNTTEGKNVTVTAKLATDPEEGYIVSESNPETFEVAKLNTTIVIIPDTPITAHKPSTATVTVSNETSTLPAGETVKVFVTQGDAILVTETPLTTDENGQVKVDFTPENTEQVIIKVKYDETPVYNENIAEEVINDIQSANIIMNVTAEDTVINGTSKVTVTLTDDQQNPIKGTVELTIPGMDKPVTVNVAENGKGTYAYKDTHEGKNVTITANLVTPTEGYNPVEPQDVTIEVAKLNTTIVTLPDSPVTAHKPTSATVTISNDTKTLPAGETVKVTVTQNGHEIASETLNTDKRGQVTIDYTPISTNDVTINVEYNETPVYNKNANTTIVSDIKPMPTFLNITSEDVIINQTSNIKLNATDELGNPVTGTALLIVDGDFVEVELTDGAGLYEYTNTTVGKNVSITGYVLEDATNGYLKSPVTITEFVVDKLNTTVQATVTNTTITNFKVDVNVKGVDTDAVVENGTVEVYIGDEKVGEGQVENGVARNVKLDINDVGKYTLKVKYDGNEVFNGNETTLADVQATKIGTTTTLKITNNTAGNVTFEAEVLDANGDKVPDGIVNITITNPDGTTKKIGQAPVQDGIATITTNLNKTGDYNFTAGYQGTDKYNSSTSSKLPEQILPRTADIAANVVNDTLNNTVVNVTLTDPTTQSPIPNAPIQVLDENGTKVGEGRTDKNGNANITLTVPVGPENLTVLYPGNATYNTTNTSLPITVQPRPSKTTITLLNDTAGNVTVKATVTDKQNGKKVTSGPIDIVAIDKNGNEKIVGKGIFNGTNTIPITTDIDEIGDYNLTARFKGNENYTESEADTLPTKVVGRQSNLTTKVSNNTVGNTTINATLKDPVTGKPIADAPVIVTLPNGTNVTGKTDDKGKVAIPVDLPAGKQNVTVTYPGNDEYNATNTTVPVDVQKRGSKLTPKVANNTVGNTTINATLTDPVTGKPIANAPVTVTLPNGTKVTAKTDDEGKVAIPVDLPAGKQNVTVTYPGNDQYKPVNTTLPVNVVKRPTKTTAKVANKTAGNLTITANVTDKATGNSVPDGPVNATVNGKVVGTGTVKDGIATIPTNINKTGKYNITLNYGGNKNYTNSTANINNVDVTPRQSDLKVDVNNNTVGNTSINVTLTDPATGKPIANAPITVTLPNGTNITTKTNSNGKATIPLNTTEGKQNIKVTYPGDNTYKAANKTVPINVQKVNVTITIQPINPVKINKTYLINATVVDSYGKPVKEGQVQLTVNGTDIGKVTLTNGTVYAKYSNPLKGTYPVVAKYLGTTKYNTDTDNTTVDILKLNTTITLTDMSAVIGDKIEIAANVTDENNNPVTDGNVIIKLNGLTIKDSNDQVIYADVVNGIAKIKFTVPLDWRGSSYNMTAVYGGTSRVYESSRGGPNKLIINYRTADIKLTLNPTTSCMDKTVKFIATVFDKDTKVKIKNGNVIFKINGQTLKDANGTAIQAKVENGLATYNYTLPDGMKARDYNITAVYAYKDFYRAEDSTNLTVTRVDIHFNVTEEVVNKKLVIKGKLLDPSNHTTVGQNTACIKINGETIKKADNNTQYFAINDGIVDITVNVPSKWYNKTINTIEIVTGDRYAYNECRYVTKQNITVV
ncbi:MAG: hypothetical protein BZ136_02005, partial [Methanosphaera sp. rholeuAM74]